MNGSSEASKQALGPSSEPSAEQIEPLLSSPEFIEALQSEHFREFLDHLPVGIVVAKLMLGQERIIYSNRAFESLTGIGSKSARGQAWSLLDIYKFDADQEIRLGQAIVEGDEYLGAFRLETEAAKLTALEAYVTTVETEDGADRFRLAVLVDATGRELSDRDQFDRQLRDKEMLLKELQHRVRNSLQIITALVRLEAHHALEGRTTDFESIASRIQALAMLYESLSNSSNSQIVDLGEYLSGIASASMRSHAKEGIRLDMKVESCLVSINVAMPAGLVVNELLTNAFKHAFLDRESGTITLRCLRQGDRCSITIADDGAGLSREVGWPPEGKISALIVRSLQENARTNVVVESAADEGTRVSFTVPTLASDEAIS